MEAIRFLNILKKHKYTIVVIPILVMIIAFFLTSKLPNIYLSKGTLTAGIVKASSSPASILEGTPLQESKVNQEFGNLIQLMQMKKVYDQLSYKLILHDLKEPVPFRKPSKLMSELNQNARAHAIDVYTDLYNKREPLSLWNADQKGLNELIISMGYDYESLLKKMRIYRIDNSDFITVEYESENPVLSAFAVNTMSAEFMAYHNYVTHETERNAIAFLENLVTQKRNALTNQVDSLRKFKIENHILNLGEQAKNLYSQMSELEGKIETGRKEIDANNSALDNINGKFTSEERRNIDRTLVELNRSIASMEDKISELQSDYTRTGDLRLKYSIDSMNGILKQKILAASERSVSNPQAMKDNLVNQRISLEVNRDMAQASIKTLQNELVKQKKRFDSLVPNEAVIQGYEGAIAVASKEYQDVQAKFNQASMAFNNGQQVKQIEMAMPGNKQPSKKMLLVLVSGVGSVVLCLLVLFILFYIDNSIKFVSELANKTNLRVLGILPFITHSSLLDLNQLWANDNQNDIDKFFRNQLRSVRYETELCMEGSHMLATTSMTNGEGKTFLAMCLASAYTMVNKKVLLIDGNFTHNDITRIANPTYFIEDYLTNKINIPYPGENNDITIIGNRGMDISLFEINTEPVIRQKIQQLKEAFDIIIVETPSLNAMNQAKEWLTVSDKVVAAFETNRSLHAEQNNIIAYLKTLENKFIGWVMNKLIDENEADNKLKKFFSKKAA